MLCVITNDEILVNQTLDGELILLLKTVPNFPCLVLSKTHSCINYVDVHTSLIFPPFLH